LPLSLSFTDTADLQFVRIKLPRDAIVNSVEEFFDENYSTRNPDEIILYGYSHVKDKENTSGTIAEFYDGKLQSDINRPIGFRESNGKIDWVNYLVTTSPRMFHGMSGSPVFFIFNCTNRKESKIVLGGICSQSNDSLNDGLIVKAGEIIRQLKGHKY
ncbi:MAG TPA: hypothetical protein VKU83_00810, partial [Puia sp.]|nr:hypothetical protein [Puia sp.]